jgi:hypothetical protein
MGSICTEYIPPPPNLPTYLLGTLGTHNEDEQTTGLLPVYAAPRPNRNPKTYQNRPNTQFSIYHKYLNTLLR